MSYAATQSLVPSQGTDAEFRAWGSAVGIKLALMGLVQTSDTGQINWTTVVKPAGASASQGYEIWRFADSLQATDPVFIKLEYGSSSVASSIAGMWITVGTATNGAGTLTGTTSTRYAVGLGTNDATTRLSVFSGDTDRFAFALFSGAQAGNLCLLISVEREVNSAGTRIAGGCLITIGSTNNGTASAPRQEYYDHGIAAFAEASLGFFYPTIGAGVEGTEVGLSPQYHARGTFLPAGLNTMGYIESAIAANTTFSATVYGAAHTYYALGSLTATTAMNRTGNASGRVALRYE